MKFITIAKTVTKMKLSTLAKMAIDKIGAMKLKLDIYINLKLGKYKSFKIVKASEIGEIVNVFKPITKEKVKLMRVFGFIEDGSFELTYPAINLNLFEDAMVEGKTDYVIVGDKIFWPKYFRYNFNKNIARDKDLFEFRKNTVIIRTPVAKRSFEVAFSLLGVHAHVWSHSLSEYYTKLVEIKNVLSIEKGELIVLCPRYTDEQLKKIVYDYLSNYDRVKIVPVEDGEVVMVKRLYYMERPAALTDHETYVAIGDNMQPKIVADIIRMELVMPLTRCADDLTYPKKLFLPRRSLYRGLTNNDEVEAYFKSKGFVFIEPHKISLEEKIKYFRNADIIVGPFSSAFSNVVFSKPGTKVLMFSNYQRIFESWLSMHYQHFNIDMLFVTGFDVKKENSAHTSFYIPLDKIKEASRFLGI